MRQKTETDRLLTTGFAVVLRVLDRAILKRETFSCFSEKESTPSLKCSSKVGLMPSCCPGNKALSGKQWGDWCSPIGCVCACACVDVYVRVGGTGCLAVRGNKEQTDVKEGGRGGGERAEEHSGENKCGCPNTIVQRPGDSLILQYLMSVGTSTDAVQLCLSASVIDRF